MNTSEILDQTLQDERLGETSFIRILPTDRVLIREQTFTNDATIIRDNAIRSTLVVAPEFREDLLSHLSDPNDNSLPILVRHFIDQGLMMEEITEEVMIDTDQGPIPASFGTGKFRPQQIIDPDSGELVPTGARYKAFSHHTLEWITPDDLLHERAETSPG